MKGRLVFELQLPIHYYFLKPIWDHLDKETCYFSLLDSEFENIAPYLESDGFKSERIFPASTINTKEFGEEDVFVSPTSWSSVVPLQIQKRVQVFHSLADKGVGGELEQFTHFFITGPNHRKTFERKYGKPEDRGWKTYDIGYPKLDNLLKGHFSEKDRDFYLRKLGLDAAKPIVIYAPTWEANASLINDGMEIMDTLAGMDLNLLIKLHPMSLRDPRFTAATGGIDWRKIVSFLSGKYPSVHLIEDSDADPYLYLADLLVTDASGIGFEFLSLDKPVVFYDVPLYFEQHGKDGVEYWGRDKELIVKSPAEMAGVVKNELRDPAGRSNKRNELIPQLIYNPGKAGEKAAKEIKRLLANELKTWPFFNAKTSGLHSIIIPTYDNPEDLNKCIENIEAETPEKHEIIIVDDGSSSAFQIVKKPHIKYIRLPFNKGPQAARNRGILEARGQFLIFMDDDVEVSSNWLKKLKKTMTDRSVDLVGPRSRFARSEQMVSPFKESNIGFSGLLDTFCLLVRNEVVEKIGGFDPNFAGEWGADDFSLRAKLAGFKAAVADDVEVYHRGNKTLARLGDMVEMSHKAWRRFTAKWDLPQNRHIIDGFDTEDVLAGKAYGDYYQVSLFAAKQELTLTVITKDEEDNIGRCLASMQDVADEIILVDTGSTDRTIQIAESFGAKVLHQQWEGDFSKPRNYALEKSSGNWVMFLDADEELAVEDKGRFRALLYDDEAECWFYTLQNFVGDGKSEEAVLNSAMRMWRNRPHYRFHGALHEQIYNKIAERGTSKFSDLRINHYGYMNKPLLEKGKLARNLEIAKQQVKDRPKDSFALFNLGVEYYRGKDFDDALESFRKSFFNLPNMTVQYAHMLVLNLAVVLRELGRMEEALEILEEAKQAYPDFRDLYYLEAIIQSERKDFETALRSLDNCMAIDKDNPEYVRRKALEGERSLFSKGRILEMMGDVRQAVKEYTAAIKKNPRFVEAILRLGSLMLNREEDPEELRLFLEKHVDLEDWRVLECLYDVFASSKHHKIAWSFLDKALDLNPGLPQADLKRANALLHSGNYAQAELLYLKIYEDTGDYRQIGSGLVFAELLQGKNNEAREALARAEESISEATCLLYKWWLGQEMPAGRSSSQKSTLFGAYWGLLEKFIELNEYEHFEKFLILKEQIKIADEGDALRLGKLFYKGHLYQLAGEHLLEAARAGNCDAEGWSILAKIAEQNEQKEDAIVFLKQALTLNENILGNYTKLASLLSEMGYKKECQEVLEIAREKFPHTDSLQRAVEVAKLFTS